MKFAIVGAGAIGAFLGAMLARAGEDVTLIARGPHLRAMQQHGIRIRGEFGEFQVAARATDNVESIGEVDVVVLTLKTHSVPAIAATMITASRTTASLSEAKNSKIGLRCQAGRSDEFEVAMRRSTLSAR